ncbi:hypothetical protein AB0878_46440 [Amycolatopsis sp. NPDC047767]|uniref:hypothetical protein n=1 Tax=Amycolatopsis sp. NPDC047767 TaxID=3156765 RepID=UPI00345617B9
MAEPNKRKRQEPRKRVARTQLPESKLAAASQARGERTPVGHLAKPRRLKSDPEAISTLLDSDDIPPDLLVELLLPLLWLDHAAGAPGSLCVSGSMMLHYAFAQLGIASEVYAVDVTIKDERTGGTAFHGRPDPYWDGDTFHGHCLIHLPGSQRAIDPAVEQFPEVKRSNLPLFGRTVLTGSEHFDAGETVTQGKLPAHWMLYMNRRNQEFLYTVVGPEYERIVWESPRAAENAERYRAAGVNLATHALSLLHLPDVADRVRQAGYPKLNALLDAIGDAPVAADRTGDFRVTLDGRSLRIDEIPLPAEADGRPPDLASAVPHLVMDRKYAEAAMSEVDAAVELLTTTPDSLGGGSLPVAVFEPKKVIGATSRSTGKTLEIQVEHIVLSGGFGRLPPTTAAEIPHLPAWTVRRTALGLELWDHGGIWARAELEPDEDWLQAAEKHKRVLVVYAAIYGVRARADLLAVAGRRGFAAGAIVSWRWTSAINNSESP